jgi:sugar phosphate isomerase/epimerase
VLEVAEVIPFRYLIQHLGVQDEEFDERKVDAAFATLEEVSLFARHRGVEVLLENTPNSLASPERLLYFFEATHMNLNVCFDLGHANMKDGVEAAYKLLAPRIRSTHVHDNDGSADQHLFPFAEGGTVDWKKAMKALRSAPDQYPMLLELREVADLAKPLDRVREIFERLENLDTED